MFRDFEKKIMYKQICIVFGLTASVVIDSYEINQREANRKIWDPRLPERHSRHWNFFGERQLAQPSENNRNITGDRHRGALQYSQKSVQNSSRDKRLFSIFTVVKFDNNLCSDPAGENGTCLSPTECAQKRGIANGICANGYGVCCTVTATCGQTTSDNNTYFVNTNYPSTFDGTGSCQLTLLKTHPDVCQFRLDFVQFNIRGPEPMNHVCSYDQFMVSGASPVPPICGNNDGNHMYIDAGVGQTNPIILTVVTSGSSFARNWKIRVSQIPCSTIYRAEEGCLQFFTGVSGQIKSFNYNPNTGLQLSNQDYSICMRMERNFCSIQYMPCLEEEQLLQGTVQRQQTGPLRSNAFTLTGNTQGTQIASMTGTSCQTDWLMIPCATNLGKIIPPGGIQCVDRLCGGTFNADGQSLNSSSIVSSVKPFRLVFHTDSIEAPNDVGNRGFCLNYVQQPCTAKLR